jgi:hypothetical protein
MAGDKLFEQLLGQATPWKSSAPLEPQRLREPKRDQIGLRAMDINSLISQAHPVRGIWSYAAGLGPSKLENRIKSWAADASATSFRREMRFDRHPATAQAVVDELKREVDALLDASDQCIKEARELAAREGVEPVEAAQKALAEIKHIARSVPTGKNRRSRGPPPPMMRVVRMTDGGARRPTTCRWLPQDC